MKDMVLFGAGNIGKEAAAYFLCEKKRNVKYFIDNDEEKQGTEIFHIPVIGLKTYLNMDRENTELVLCLNKTNLREVKKQLIESKIEDYAVFEKGYRKERIISYTSSKNMEDVILYHVLRNEKEIFYIDIGSNDPFCGSVTKLLYDMRNAHGINVEPQEYLIVNTNRERTRDINLCIAVGAEKKKAEFFYQGGLSTFIPDNVKDAACKKAEIDIITLKEICDSYLEEGTNISFLKIDVEGYEREVLLGADFDLYRPNIVVIEATKPCTLIANYEGWEDILTRNSYHYVYSHGVNRYYVADERQDLDQAFCEVECIEFLYNIFYAEFKKEKCDE